MPRLGIPANIDVVSALFRQPGDKLNPLALTWNYALEVRLVRTRLGSRIFAAFWSDGPRRWPIGLHHQSVVPLAAQVRELFHEQLTEWKAYRSDGTEEPAISEEIQKQLHAFYRGRGPKRKPGERAPGQTMLAGFG